MNVKKSKQNVILNRLGVTIMRYVLIIYILYVISRTIPVVNDGKKFKVFKAVKMFTLFFFVRERPES